jgi:2-keto-4-pentenoate hydratase/2-oxohepta-3-ene-1,7-dioic acid hydratase in catechol pathway
MKIARFVTKDAAPRFGVLDDTDLVVLRGDPLFDGYETTGERVPITAVRLLAPVIPRSKIVCVGRNYAAHAAEKGNEVPDHPLLFLNPNTAVIGPGDAIRIPPFAGTVELEAELALVIGRTTRRLPADRWREAVFGFTVANDVSSRTLQRDDRQWARAKGMDTFCPLGPVVETDLDAEDVTVSSQVNGEPAQHGSTRDLIFRLGTLVETISDAFTLLPGDVILTGTPAGVRPITPGDVVTCTVSGIGSLVNPVVARD